MGLLYIILSPAPNLALGAVFTKCYKQSMPLSCERSFVIFNFNMIVRLKGPSSFYPGLLHEIPIEFCGASVALQWSGLFIFLCTAFLCA